MSNTYGYNAGVPPQDPRSRITQALMAQANPPPVPPGSGQLPGMQTQQPLTPSPAPVSPLSPQPASLMPTAGAAPLGPMGPIGGPQQAGLTLPGMQPPGIGNIRPNY